MPDSDGAPEQDAITITNNEDWKVRFDGLMGAHQKALARVRELEAPPPAPAYELQPAGWPGPEPALPDVTPEVVEEPPQQDSRSAQPKYEPGMAYTVNDEGDLEEWTPPRPLGVNGPHSQREMKKGDDGSAGYLQGKLAEQGFRPRSTDWP